MRFFLALILLFPFAISGIELKPMTMNFSPTGKQASRTFTVSNPSTKEWAAVQVSMVRRLVDLDGKESYPEAEDDFIVYPEQMVLKPEQTQVVRVSWIGDKSPLEELPYRIIAEQLPVDFSKEGQDGGGKIKILMRFIGSVYILPEGVRSKIVLTELAHVESESAEDLLQINFHNEGTKHAFLHNIEIVLKDEKGETVTLTSEDLKKINGANLLAKTKRQCLIPWPAKLAKGKLSSNFTIDE